MRPPGRADIRAAGRPGRFGSRPPWARHRHADWPPAAVVAAVLFHVLGAIRLSRDGLLHRDLDVLSYLVLLVGPLALFWRRRAPLPVLVVAAVPSIVFATRAAPHWTYAVAPAIALFTLAGSGRWRAAFGAALAGLLGYLLVTVGLAGPLGLPAMSRPEPRQMLLAAAGLVGSVVLGSAARARGEQLAAIAEARAEQARAREEQERRLASEERLRIARELHDVLGHHLSLINVQAGVGLHLMDSRPEQAREALSAIKTASSEALREVRSVLGVLRTEGEVAPRQPALGLNRLGELTADAGIPVRTTVSGQPRELPAEVDRAAYRIVQEALTNVRRHAGPEPDAAVSVGYRPGVLHLAIRSAGAAEPPGGATERGSGITGMRARAESLGGRLEAGRTPDGGFLVSAVLPAPVEEEK